MKSPVGTFILVFVLLLALAVVSLISGAVSISVYGVMQWMIGMETTLLTQTERTILMQLRLPRVITACLVGSSLGIAGVGFQGLFRNPLADPFVI
ncbi:MAG TPA: iron chelate uptake ABC transporter family permease subunit, partial [Pirellula sp.]|nr:iron chelate uptake ABC transporter family permease subunit [Pirellula sp.]